MEGQFQQLADDFEVQALQQFGVVPDHALFQAVKRDVVLLARKGNLNIPVQSITRHPVLHRLLVPRESSKASGTQSRQSYLPISRSFLNVVVYV